VSKKDWKLLQAYLATGLTPEQITELKRSQAPSRHVLSCAECRWSNAAFASSPCQHCEAFEHFKAKKG